ncbi:unnamed protein product [Mesocestoides corti]|uniref:Zinc finger MYND domain-containing protein 10 n=2 Tax=Mesocestoides corti TaxID=53468 RepID=A0A0R3UHE3_MESCO|nr:unnamed protein product [Mesocestoides corti]
MRIFPYIVFPAEAEALVASLADLDYETYGSEHWYKQHTYLDKLNMQAVVSARARSDEFVKEFIISHQKVGFLIRDLVSSELWRQKIFKRLLKSLSNDVPTFPIYVILYHELILSNLLETVAYHMDVVDSLRDDAVDLCDWCHRALCRLVAATSSEEKKAELHSLKDQPNSSETNEAELCRQAKILTYEIGMKAVSLSRHLIDHSCSSYSASVSGSTLPLSVGRRLLHTHDFLILLCHLIDLAPWNCAAAPKKDCYARLVKYQWHESGCWIAETDDKNWTVLTKTEGQVWLSIYQLLFSNLIPSVNYDLTASHRKQALLRLRPHLTEVCIDVIPVLGELRRFLEEFAVCEGSALASRGQAVKGHSASASAVAQLCHVEVIADIYEGIQQKYRGKWKEVASEFMQRIQSEAGRESAKRAASKWADAFTEDNVNALFGADATGDTFEHPLLPPPRCVECGEIATKRCSRCRQEWYCRRECQVKHWPRHKKACDIFVSCAAADGEKNGRDIT